MAEELPYQIHRFLKSKTSGRISWFLANSVILCFLWGVFLAAPTVAGGESMTEETAEKLVPAGEEQLLMFFEPGEIVVTTSARRPQPIVRATSAMYVITAEDIRQAGVSHLADILRLVPGMDVAHVKGYGFAVSARGFAKQANLRMQVLMDGRPMYDPYKGGVDLVYHPIFAENIERIEVIRGSGGVVWGVNAMNGVINIITKKASDTQGGFGYGGFSNRILQDGYMRLGGTEGQMSWRGTVGALRDRGFGTTHGKDIEDYARTFQSTGRADLKLSDNTELTLSGGHKLTRIAGQRNPMQYMNLLWRKNLTDDSSLQVRWSEYFYRQIRSAFDLRSQEDMLEIQHNFVSGIHSIVCGAAYIRDTYHTSPGTLLSVNNPDRFANDQASAFMEDEIALAKNLWLTVGKRLYYNELTDYDWAGRTALVWEAAPKHFIRAAISKSFRIPLIAAKFGYKVNILKGLRNYGNDKLGNEKLISYELGYRGRIRKNLELNIEGFINKHSNLISSKGKTNENILSIKTYGVETAVNWRPYDWWLVRGFHVYEHQTDENKLNDKTTGSIAVWPVPQHKVGLTNRFYLDDSTTINTQLFWSDAFLSREATPDVVEPYFRFDVRLAKRIWNDSAEVAFGVTNLTEHYHYEGNGNVDYRVPRLVYLQLFYEF